MNALFAWLDVDRVQWGALVRAALRVDFAVLRSAHGSAASRRAMLNVSVTLLIYVVAGASPAFVAWFASDVLFAGTFMVTIVGFMVASTLLLGEGATLVSPSDHHVLGFRPVTSRTYLAVRIAGLLIRTAVISTSVAIAPVAVFLLKGGLHPGLAAAALAAAYATGLAVTLAIVALYGWMLRVAGPMRMKRYASYTQFTAQMVTWGGFVLVTQEIGRRAVAGVSLSDGPWAMLYPGTWFGSYVALASGGLTWMTLVSAVLSVVLVIALARAIGGKLSLGYAESLGRLTAVAAPRNARGVAATRWTHLLDSETRAIAILVRSHLQHDMKFRLALISLIPITLLYMYMGGLPGDPFAAEGGGDDAVVIQMALIFLPLTLRRALVTSETYRASWIFHTTPADRAKLVLSARNIITLFFLLPYLLFLAAMLTYAFGDWRHALVHAAFTGLVSYMVLQFTVMMNPQLPFSLPVDKETQGGQMFALMFGAMVVGLGLYFLLTAVVYKTPLGMAIAVVAFAGLAYLMDRIARRRATNRLVGYTE